MERKSVSSSNLSSIGYDPTTRTLEIEFNSGAIYQYSGVPEPKYEALMNAASIGSHFAAHFRDRYPTTRIM
jgi:hypothetical protein